MAQMTLEELAARSKALTERLRSGQSGGQTSSWDIPGLAPDTSAEAASYYALAPTTAPAAPPVGPMTKASVEQDLKAAEQQQIANVKTLNDLFDAPDKIEGLKSYLRNNGFVFADESSSVGERILTGPKNTLALANAAATLVQDAVRYWQDKAGRPLVEKILEKTLAPSKKLVGQFEASAVETKQLFKSLPKTDDPVSTQGRALLEANLDEKVRETKGLLAGAELLARSAGMLVGGPKLLEQAPDEMQQRGIKYLEEKLGTTGAAVAFSAAQQLGELPLWLINFNKILKIGEAVRAAPGVTQGTKALTSIATSAAAGAAAGGTTALFLPPRPESEIAPGMTVTEGLAGGAFFGGTFAAVAAGLSRLRANNWRVANKLAEFEREDWFNVRRAALAEAEARGELLAKSPTVAYLTPETVRQMESEIISFRPTPRPDIPKRWFGPAVVHFDEEFGPHVRFVERVDKDTVPEVSVAPLTDANVQKLRKATSDMEGYFSLTPEALSWLGSDDRDAAAIYRLLTRPMPVSEKARAWQEAFDRAVLQNELVAKAPRGGEVVVNGMAVPHFGDVAMEVKLLPDGSLDAVPVRVGKVYPAYEPVSAETIKTDLYDLFGKTEPSTAQQTRTQVPLGGFLAEDLPEAAPRPKKGSDTNLGRPSNIRRNEAPTQRADVGDLLKMGFRLEGAGIGAGSIKGGDVEKVPVGFLAKKSSKGGEPQKLLPAGAQPKLLRPGGEHRSERLLPAGGQARIFKERLVFEKSMRELLEAPRPRTAPEPPPAVPPERDYAPMEYADLADAIESIKENLGKDDSLLQKIYKGVVSNHLRGPTAWAAFKTSLRASEVLQRSSEEIVRAAQKRFGNEFLSTVDRKLDAYFKGYMTLDKVVEELPVELRAEAYRFAQELNTEKMLNEQKMRELGILDPDAYLRDSGLEDLYLARRYLLYALPQGRWARALKDKSMQHILERGVDYIYDVLKKANPDKVVDGVVTEVGLTRDEVVYEVLELLKERDPLAVIREGRTRLSPLKSLIARKDIPEPIRELLGEVHSGMFNIAHTLGTQRSLIARHTLYRDFAANPANWSPRPNEALGHMYQIPENRRVFGDMAGKYVTKEAYEGLLTLQQTGVMSHRLLSTVAAVIKGNQTAMGGVGPLLNSTFGNLWSGLLAGGLDPTNIRRSGRAMYYAVRALFDHMEDPTGTTGYGWIVNEARLYGADFFGFSHEEVGNPFARKLVRDWDKILPDGGEKDLFYIWKKINEYTFENYRNLQEKLGVALDMNDRLFRIQSYIALREKFLKDFADNPLKSEIVREGLLDKRFLDAFMARKEGGGPFPRQLGKETGDPRKIKLLYDIQKLYFEGGLPKDLDAKALKAMTEDPYVREVTAAAAKLAARRINQSFWNPTFIGPELDKLRKGAVGIVAPYATAAFETARINGMLPSRLKNEKDLRWRLLAGTAMVSTAFGANSLLRHYNGISDAEVDAARDSIPDRVRVFRPFLLGMAWRDAEGRVQFWDYSRQFDPLRYFAGDPSDNIAKRFIANLLVSPVEGGGADEAVRQLEDAVGLATNMAKKRSTRLSDSEAEKLMNLLFDRGLAPGLLRGAYTAARNSDLIGGRPPTVEKLTPAQAVVRAVGISNIVPVGPTTKRAQMLEDRAFLKNLKSERRNVNRQNISLDEKLEKQQRLTEEQQKFNERRRERTIFRGNRQ